MNRFLSSLTAWVRKKWPLKCLIVSACGVATYVGIFSYVWTTSPLEDMRYEGGVRIKARKILCRRLGDTQVIWEPAFWYMVHVQGYFYTGYIAQFEDSAWVYGK